ncbi:MAG: type II secretion system protein GspD, partial [Pseudomonas sp.]
NPFTTVERKDIGISLKIRPHINEGSNLRLEVQQESSEIIPGLEGDDIITNKRSLKSTILADDGQIIVLGGLIKDSVRSEQSAVPLLGRLPLIGGLFRWRSDTQVKTNLMVFLRPTVLRSAEALEQRSRQGYDAIRRGSPEGWLDNDPAGMFEPSTPEPAR